MQINYHKAYEYYKSNISRSCDQKVLSFEEFHPAFGNWIHTLMLQEQFGMSNTDIPLYNEKCGTSRMLNLQIVLKKCQ